MTQTTEYRPTPYLLAEGDALLRAAGRGEAELHRAYAEAVAEWLDPARGVAPAARPAAWLTGVYLAALRDLTRR